MSLFFFFNDTATTEIYTLSLHDALPISIGPPMYRSLEGTIIYLLGERFNAQVQAYGQERSEEHTSELQSRLHLVCRLLLEKKKNESRERSTQTMKRTLRVT